MVRSRPAVSPNHYHLCFCFWLHPFFLLTSVWSIVPVNKKRSTKKGANRTVGYKLPPKTGLSKTRRFCAAHTHLQHRRPRRHRASAASTQSALRLLRSPSTRAIASNCTGDGSFGYSHPTHLFRRQVPNPTTVPTTAAQ